VGGLKVPIYVFSGTRQDFDWSQVTSFALHHDVGLIVVDSLSKFWSLRDENDAVQVERAIGTILEHCRACRAAVVLIHHLRKSGGAENLDTRGSGALL